MLASPPHQSNSVGIGRFVIVPSSSERSPDERSHIRDHIFFNSAFAGATRRLMRATRSSATAARTASIVGAAIRGGLQPAGWWVGTTLMVARIPAFYGLIFALSVAVGSAAKLPMLFSCGALLRAC